MTAATTTVTVGDRTVHRLGFGAMRIVGPGVWGEPADPEAMVALLRAAVEAGVDFVDTADSYGPFVSEDLIRRALHPYDGVMVATKGGLLRTAPDRWHPLGEPTYLRQCVEMSLRRLGVETIDLYQLHRVDRRWPLADQLGVLRAMQQEGKIRHIGLSEVDVDTLRAAQEIITVASVQNIYNLAQRQHEAVVDACTEQGIAFIPWYPIAGGALVRGGDSLAAIADEVGATPAQVGLAWLLQRSPVMLPIPGTSKVSHLHENMAAADLVLDAAVVARLDALAAD